MSGLDRLAGFIEGWRFPTLLLSVLVAWPALLLGILAIPASAGPLAEFATQFKVWCLGYDPATGELEGAYVAMLLINPLVLVAIVGAVWHQPLREAWTSRRSGVGRWAGGGLAFTLALGVGLTLMTEPGFDAGAELPFPAEVLRTSHTTPAFELVDQAGDAVSSTHLVDRVTLLTAVYASCPHTCPVILTEARQALATLPSDVAAHVQVLAVTMDPANDGPEELAALATMHGLDAPRYRLLSGPEPVVEELLDDLQIARERDPETGVIHHSNQFILVGRDGRIAYRLALGDQLEQWLPAALTLLVAEEPGPVG